ncbi:hypothetical protein [Kocuria tytonis]|uniref:Uncharacterized protein n=1 Tax=Kocuria tytonis TaxID=2054280 RepID=A0A495A3M5_9MICC|nr:hypothetical protein [Kocuria tytonis]RKQ34128.1 hypothetical protein C1C97_009795 [Kocuria tytonis]
MSAPRQNGPDVPEVSAASFAALCRSSPWRWHTLRFTLSWVGGDAASPAAPVRAWLRRPSDLRVETVGGAPLYTTTSLERSRDDFYVTDTPRSWLLPPALVAPVYDDHGLVTRRPDAAYGDPIFGGGRWQAILDPVELAGPAPTPPYLPEARPAVVRSVAAGAFAKRRVWCATVAPTVRYRPVTSGHPLAPGPTRVAVDTATGVCVYSHVLHGPHAGQGHRLVIEGVDEYQLDDLFTRQDFDLTDVSRHVPWPVDAR